MLLINSEKEKMNTRSEKAVYTFDNGYNCSQSVFSVFAEEFGLSRELSLRLAGPLGAGIGRRQETCGAVTGALMALGLKYGKGETGSDEDKKRAFAKAEALMQAFEARHGSVRCLTLLDGHRMDSPGGAAAIAAAQMFDTRCAEYVKTSVELAESLMESEP